MRGWYVLLAALLLLVIFLVADARLKRAPHPGFAPADARWRVFAPDTPFFWSRLETTPEMQAFRRNLSKPLARFELEVRKGAGIRPIPPRWGLWLGRQTLASGGPAGAGICVYPGILLRTAEKVLSRTAGRTSSPIQLHGPYHYAWRDGFLIVSTSRAYVEAALAAPQAAPSAELARDAMELRWSAEPAGQVVVSAQNGLPVHGTLAAHLSRRREPLTLPGAFPDPPIISITASNWAELKNSLALAALPWRERPWFRAAHEGMRALLQTWGFPLPRPGWDARIDQCALALFGLHAREGWAVPEAALALRCPGELKAPHPLAVLAAPEAIPFVWGGYDGSLTPVWGDAAALCIGRSAQDWLVATREPLMARLAKGMAAGHPVEAEVAVRICWTKTGPLLRTLIERAGEWNLVPGRDAREVIGEYGPVAVLVGQLGELEVEASAVSEDRIEIRGHLAGAPARASADSGAKP